MPDEKVEEEKVEEKEDEAKEEESKEEDTKEEEEEFDLDKFGKDLRADPAGAIVKLLESRDEKLAKKLTKTTRSDNALTQALETDRLSTLREYPELETDKSFLETAP